MSAPNDPQPNGAGGDPRTGPLVPHETEAATYSAWRVKMKADEGAAWWVVVPRAMGRHDAMNQARQKARDEGEDDASPIEVVPFEPKDWDALRGEPENVLRQFAGDR